MNFSYGAVYGSPMVPTLELAENFCDSVSWHPIEMCQVSKTSIIGIFQNLRKMKVETWKIFSQKFFFFRKLLFWGFTRVETHLG
jgi:hypothetical protein